MAQTGASMIHEPYAGSALWSRRLGLFAIPVALIAVLAQRSGRLEFLPAVAALGSGMVLALLAILLGVVALAVIWVRGNQGAAAAAVGIVTGALILAPAVYYVAPAWELPALTDIATDPGDPPAFVFAAAERGPGDNPLAYPGEQAAIEQLSAYPDIQPLRITPPPEEAQALALQIVETRGWRVLDSGSGSTRIEAVDTSLILHMSDDIVIEIKPDGAGSRVEMRSASRTGTHDLGANAARIRAFLTDLAAAAR